ncbi:MAG: bifunctional folylpolyglutamate synthase/dihydrofolate synthase, partial [Planctomycetota bacterium]
RVVIEQICRERGAPLVELSRDFHYAYQPGQIANGASAGCYLCRPGVQVSTRRHQWTSMELGLLGEHQAANAAVAVACVEQLRARGWHIPDRAVSWGLAHVSWPARLEIVARQPLVVLDCAHNVASAAALVETLRTSFPPRRRLLVFAASNDKDVAGMFRELAPHFSHAFLTRFTSNPRSVPPEQLADLLKRCGVLPCTTHATAREAMQAARAAAGQDSLICIAGSVYLAGELRPMLVGETAS